MEPNSIVVFVRSAWQSATRFARAHRLISGIIALVIAYGLWQGYAALTAAPKVTRYVTATVATGTVVATMSETGQVSALDQVELDSKASGEVLTVLVSPGQRVAAGTAIAAIDPTTEQEAVASAKQALQSAQIALDKQNGPSTMNDSSYNDVASAMSDMGTDMAGLDSILHDTSSLPGNATQSYEDAYANIVKDSYPAITGYRDAAERSYQAAHASYELSLAESQAASRTSDSAALAAVVEDSYATAVSVSEALHDAETFLTVTKAAREDDQHPVPAVLTSQLASLAGYISTVNGHVASLAADRQTLAGATFDTRSSQISLQGKQDALRQAEQALADTVVRAPFSGTVASVAVERYENISDGAPVAVMTSDNQGVDISVNEVDAAKLRVGEKATITFDALPDITLAGTVSSVNTVGTASQGVVSYGATVTFDTPNPTVLPGMSATADIVTGTATGLVVPASAVKTSGGRSMVMVFDPPLAPETVAAAGASGVASAAPPTEIPVTTGLSSDTDVIIMSGLAGGEQVVTRTVAGTSQTTSSTAAPSGGSLLFGSARGGAGTRVITR